MTTQEFNRLLCESRNGGRHVIGGSASTLHKLLSKMTVGFLRRKDVAADSWLVDDLVNSLFVLLLKHAVIPDGYTWNSWYWYAIKTVWSAYCQDHFGRNEIVLDTTNTFAFDVAAPAVSVPVAANARMMNGGLVDYLQDKVLKAGPRVSPDKDVWAWAAKMLIHHGTIQDEKYAGVRSGLTEQDCRQIIIRAVLKVRLLFEDIYGQQETVTSEECAEARELAARIY